VKEHTGLLIIFALVISMTAATIAANRLQCVSLPAKIWHRRIWGLLQLIWIWYRQP